MVRFTVAIICILSLVTSAFGGKGALTGQEKKNKIYPKTAKEAYFTKAELEWIRPGFQIQILDITIPDDLRPEVEFKLVDDLDQPLDRAGVETLGACSLSFILAWYDANERNYVAYTTRVAVSNLNGSEAIQASTDSGGSITDLAMGHGIYKFGTTLPADFDGSKTHTLAVYGNRDLQFLIDKRYVSNVTYDFRPDGQNVIATWNAYDNATCNACHQNLAIHGGQRTDVKLCTTCHSPQSTDPDTGNTVDMAVMIHKIHFGENLPSVQAGEPYQIVGYRDSVHDYSHVVLPMDIRNCTACHTGSSDWLFKPTRNSCGSCHDDIDWVNGTGHVAGAQLDDSRCAMCHIPDNGQDFGASIMGAHTIPTEAQALEGLHTEILDVADAQPGMNPTVYFRITNDRGDVVDPADLDRLNLLLAGPTEEYATYMSEAAQSASFDGDSASYTFAEPIPADTFGTWTASADVYRWLDLYSGTPNEVRVREAAENPIYHFAVTDAAPVARREIVDMAKCNDCHGKLALHGGQRTVMGECLMCHNPNTDDHEVRPEDRMPAESVQLKWMIHRIHMGEELMNDYTIFGYRSSEHNYNHVVYPGDLRNCEACHYPGTYTPPMPEGTLPTTTPREAYSPMMPAAAACLSCHDSETAALHAYVNTAPFGESCAACHGDGKAFSVDKVHAQ